MDLPLLPLVFQKDYKRFDSVPSGGWRFYRKSLPPVCFVSYSGECWKSCRILVSKNRCYRIKQIALLLIFFLATIATLGLLTYCRHEMQRAFYGMRSGKAILLRPVSGSDRILRVFFWNLLGEENEVRNSDSDTEEDDGENIDLHITHLNQHLYPT